MESSNTSSSATKDDLITEAQVLGGLTTLALDNELSSDNQLDKILSNQSDSEFLFRPLKRDDYDRGIMDVLGQLTVVGNVTKASFEERYDLIFPRNADSYFIITIEDKAKGKVVGSATLLLERKFLRSTGTCGHIEDVAVDASYRGKRLGVRLISVIKEIAIINGCYKITLDCKESNMGFYEINGFKEKERQMTWYSEDATKL